MKRFLWFFACAALASVMLFLGWLTPVHLRAVDASVLERAGARSQSLVERGNDLLRADKFGAAQLLSEAATKEDAPGHEQLAKAIADIAARNPEAMIWGGGASVSLQNIFRADSRLPKSGIDPLAEFAVRIENRDRLIDFLQSSSRPAVSELLQCRTLTNTTVFPPSTSTAGQAFDAAISICALLAEEGYMTPTLRDWVATQASRAVRGGDTHALEDALLDMLSLGQRLNWGQTAAILRRIEDANTLHEVGGVFRTAGNQLDVVYSAVDLSGKPAQVAEYTQNFSQTGLGDLGTSLRYGAGGVDELLARNRQLYSSDWRRQMRESETGRAVSDFAADYSLKAPQAAMALKWFFYLSAGFYLALALHFLRPARWDMQQPAPARGVRFGRELLFAMGALVVVLLLSEPFLAQESQKVETPFRLHLPLLGSAAPGGLVRISQSVMNPQSLLTLLLFFVLQALIYMACLVKLSEIRRQRTSSRIKLKLLENEEHLFDAGLYLGFAGTIVSLILVSLGIIKNPSLMAAYSSTAFGIIFVSIFKIFHLRPARRLILMESETLAEESQIGAEPNILSHS
jgi:hypothetical protein